MMKQIDRRRLLQISGSLGVGAVFLSFAAAGLWKMFTHPDQLFYDSRRAHGPRLIKEDENFVSPYRRTFGFLAPGDIKALEIEEGSIYLAVEDAVCVYGSGGELQTRFSIPAGLRDLAVKEGLVYALFPTSIQVYDRRGQMQNSWEACSENSDYCALAVSQEGIFVTDAFSKNICKYNLDGTLARFIQSPKGFVVPSYSFGITCMDGKIFCSNPGRHQVECYTPDGEFVASFGKSGAQPGAFSGCCNPVILTPANSGELLTSEKGIPRISCYSEHGKFRSILLDSKALGGGHEAYKVRVMKDKLIVVAGNKVSVFQYDRKQSQQTQCGQCEKDCPLKMN